MNDTRLLTSKHPYLTLFSLGMFIRGIPEVIVEKYPVGYDTTAHYLFNILNYDKMGVVEMLRQAPLFYLISYASIQLPGVDVLSYLKAAGPLLYGALCASFYFFLRKGLGWKEKNAFVSTLLFTLQLVALRLSWDMFRLELGLALMFLTLGLIVKRFSGSSYLAASLAVLVVLAHQIATLMLFFSAIWIISREIRSRARILPILIPLLPAGILFTTVLYITYLVPAAQDPRILNVGPTGYFLSYFAIDPRLSEGSYFVVARNIGMLMIFCYGLIFPFIIKGFKRNQILDPMLVIVSIGSFSPLIVPFISLPAVYWRWIFLLIIPFAAYAGCGLLKLSRLWRRRATGMWLLFLFFTSLSLGYASGALPLRSMYFSLTGKTPHAPSPGETSIGAIESVNTYVPASLVASSTSVGDVTAVIDDCIESLDWLDRNAPENSCLLTEERFTSWARLHTSERIKLAIYSGLTPVDNILERIRTQEFSHIYFIWYSNVPIENFEEVRRHGGISIYEYAST